MKIKLLPALIAFGLALWIAPPSFSQKGKTAAGIYRKDNLIAWCIVPFDSKNRAPEERAQMLNDLGITMLAYD